MTTNENPGRGSVVTLDDRWPLAEEYPCCTPVCVIWTEPDGRTEWDHRHNPACPVPPGAG